MPVDEERIVEVINLVKQFKIFYDYKYKKV